MSAKSRRRKAAARRARAAQRKLFDTYRARRLPGETSREQLLRTLAELRENPLRFVTVPETFRFYEVGAP